MRPILHKHCGLDVHLRQTLAEIGTFATAAGKPDAGAACMAFAAMFRPDAVFTVNLKVDVLLCSLVDHMRNAGRTDLVEMLEKLIALIKDGDPQRVLVGTVDYAAGSVGELDDQLEAMHHRGVEIIRGR